MPNGSICGAPGASKRKSPRVPAEELPDISWSISRKASRSSKPAADLGAWVIYLGDLGYDIAGIDNDAQVIGRLKEWRPSMNVSAGDIRELPYETGSLGAVISLGVMEHFEEGCDEAMRETLPGAAPGRSLFLHRSAEQYLPETCGASLAGLLSALEKRPWGQHPFCGVPVYDRGSRGFVAPSRVYSAPTTWDDFSEKSMSLGIWADFPPLQARQLYEMNAGGKIVAFLLNALSPWIAAAGVLCVARKPDR